jgi:alanine racemase
VLIRGKAAPILGRVCMDQMMVDVTHIPGVAPEDPVVLVGTQGQSRISVEEMADTAGSFNYEAVCAIGHRVPRYYYAQGKLVHQVNYLLDD